MRMPARRKSWSRIIVEALVWLALAYVLTVVACSVDAASGQSCVDDASDMRLRIEMAERGYQRWGCWAMLQITASWASPEHAGSSSAMHYTLHARGWGALMELDRVYRYVYAESLVTFWPAQIESVTAEVRAHNGCLEPGPWSAPSDTFLVNR